jgi:hypothetical protein
MIAQWHSCALNHQLVSPMIKLWYYVWRCFT